MSDFLTDEEGAVITTQSAANLEEALRIVGRFPSSCHGPLPLCILHFLSSVFSPFASLSSFPMLFFGSGGEKGVGCVGATLCHWHLLHPCQNGKEASRPREGRKELSRKNGGQRNETYQVMRPVVSPPLPKIFVSALRQELKVGQRLSCQTGPLEGGLVWSRLPPPR